MSTPFLAEIKILSFNFPPKGWAMCNGQLLPINQNQALFSLMGTTFGGNGQTNFALPDLRGRTPIHVGNGFVEGQMAGQESHSIISSEMPQHTHFLNLNNLSGDQTPGSSKMLANSGDERRFDTSASPTNGVAMNPQSITNTGGSQPHSNMQPYHVLNFCIALQGIFPSRN